MVLVSFSSFDIFWDRTNQKTYWGRNQSEERSNFFGNISSSLKIFFFYFPAWNDWKCRLLPTFYVVYERIRHKEFPIDKRLLLHSRNRWSENQQGKSSSVFSFVCVKFSWEWHGHSNLNSLICHVISISMVPIPSRLPETKKSIEMHSIPPDKVNYKEIHSLRFAWFRFPIRFH